MLSNQLATTSDYALVLDIWEQSVLATHNFLQPEDVTFYKTQIPQFLDQTVLRIWSLDNQPIGFSGTNGQELEMPVSYTHLTLPTTPYV